MKKRLLITGVVLFSLALTACGNKDKDNTKDSTIESSKTVETEASITSSETQGETATFKGTISELPILDEKVVPLMFDKVEAVEDPDKLIDMFNASGVMLMADLESLDGFKPEDLEVGDEIEFTIDTPAAMTHSIPPQISGSAIKSIKPLN